MRQHEPLGVFVAPVGQWLPWDPDPDAIQDSDYMLPQLNELMKKYHDNVRDKNKHFEERKREMLDNANLTNAEKKRKQLMKKLADRKKAQIDRELRERQQELAAKRSADEAKKEAEDRVKKAKAAEEAEQEAMVEEMELDQLEKELESKGVTVEDVQE